MRRFPQVRGSARGVSLVSAMFRLPRVMLLRLHGLALIAGRVLVVAPRRGAVLQTSPSRQVGVFTSVMRALTTWLMAPLPLRPTP